MVISKNLIINVKIYAMSIEILLTAGSAVTTVVTVLPAVVNSEYTVTV